MQSIRHFFVAFNFIFLLLFQSSAQTDLFIGSWNGTINSVGISLRIAFHIAEKDGIIITKMDSPDQNSFGNPAQNTIVYNDQIKIDLPLMGLRFEGVRVQDSIIGTIFQSGLELPLHLGPLVGELKGPQRPQTPQAPFPYSQKDVKIKTNNEKVKLAGTLTMPQGKGPFPAVVLISGSGPQDRNEELLLHQPFLVLADYLTRNGIAVLRYDDRGIGMSTGDFESATSFDFADDAEAAFTFLSKQKNIITEQIGFIGHSEGGLIAPIVAARNKKVGFICLMAGPSVPGNAIILDQQELIFKASGADHTDVQEQARFNKIIMDYIVENHEKETLQNDLTLVIEKWVKENNFTIPKTTSPKTFAKQTAYTYTKKWMKTFIITQPSQYIDQVQCPILAMYGENDLQVSVRANVQPMQQLLNNKENSLVHVFPKLNHLFQTTENGSPSEYTRIEETLSETFLSFVTKWIKDLP